MRKLISILLSALMIMSICAMGISAAPNADEVGKVAASYVPEGTAVSSLADVSDPAGNYYLAADITLPGTIPVTFTGTIDGNGHTITVSAPMFQAFAGTLKNVTIAGAIDNSALAEIHTGAVSAYVPTAQKAVFENVKNTATVKGVTTDFMAAAPDGTEYKYRAGCGGFIGLAEGSVEITNCVNIADITGHATGGFIGYSEGKFDEGASIVIKNSLNTGKISDAGAVKVNNNPSVGGFIGICNNTLSVTLEDLRNDGEVSGLHGEAAHSATTPAGGIIGYHYTGIKDQSKGLVTMKNIVNNANVVGSNQVGGIAGWIRINLVAEDLENNGSVKSVGNYAGGLFGRTGSDGAAVTDGTAFFSNAKLTNCVNNAPVLSYKSQTGGIIGYSNAGIECHYCTNNADITPATGLAGGILGSAGEYGTLKAYNCVNNGKIVSPDNYAGGIAGRVQGLNSKATNHSIESGGYIIDLRYCTNNGDVEGGMSTGGMVGSAGAKSRIGLESIMYCTNSGNITNNGSKTTANSNAGAGGILGYAYGAATEYPCVKYCVNTGDVTAKGSFSIAANIIAYFNSDKTVISGNVAVGKLTAEVAENVFVLCWNNASALNPDNVKGNYILSSNTYALTRESVDGNPVTNTVYECNKLEAADLTSGNVCYDLNAAIKAEDASVANDVFYQVLGVDKCPTPVYSANGVVEKNADGSFQNPKAPVVDPTPTGDSVLAVVAVMGVALVTILGTAYIIKKVRA